MGRNEAVYLAASGLEMVLPAMQMMGAVVTEVIKEDNLVSYRLTVPEEKIVFTLAVHSEDTDE